MVPMTKKRTVNYCVQVPITHYVERQVPVRVPVWKTVERECQVRVPQWNEREVTCTVMVPYQQKRQGVRKVWKTIPVETTRTICVDEGNWEEREVTPCCRRRCGKCTVCCKPTVCKVWMPKLVKKEVKATSYECELQEQPYEYTVTLCEPKTVKKKVKECSYRLETRKFKDRVCHYETVMRTCRMPVCHFETRQRSRVVVDTYCVPKTVERTCNVTTYKRVSKEVTESCIVYVPTLVKRTISVPVCKMVPRTVRVPICCSCGCSRRA